LDEISQNNDELLVTPSTATDSARKYLGSIPNVPDAGSGELNNATAWDDFPNGRFGDYKSPAFGDQGPWVTGAVVRASLSLSCTLFSWLSTERQQSIAVG
jgi:methylenetetrahydrofolate reductase (NADPH)